MRRTFAFVLVVGVVGGLLALAPLAEAHQCPAPKHPNRPTSDEACRETEVYDDWRGNYVPLFDLSERDEEQKRDAQRWRDECADDGQERQQCAWYYGGTSVTEYPETDEDGPRPNEAHVGFAATHCFLAEAAHDCDRHDGTSEFDTHDSHGGATYVDVCLTPNPDSTYCDDGMQDTQVGVTSVDHLDCPMGCMDEYHVVRPFDTAYTQEQTADSVAAIQGIAADPRTYVCGYEAHSACP